LNPLFPLAGATIFVGDLSDIGFWLQIIWWAILFYMAYWIYHWVEEKLGFSQILVFVVAGLLIYYLVIENPIIAAFGIFGWIILASGIFMFLQMVPGLMMMFHRR
jgi:hypothetical protein